MSARQCVAASKKKETPAKRVAVGRRRLTWLLLSVPMVAPAPVLATSLSLVNSLLPANPIEPGLVQRDGWILNRADL